MQELPPFDVHDSQLLSTGTWLVMIVVILALFATVVLLTLSL